MSTRPRDSQRSRLYKAEREAFGNPVHLGSRPEWWITFKTIGEAQEYLDRITSSRWFQSRWGQVRVPVKAGKGCHAGYRTSITLSRWGYNPWVLLHELSHWLVSTREVAAHGPEFAACYLMLATNVFGEEGGRVLREAYVKHRIRYRGGTAAIPKANSRKVVTKTAVVARLRAEAKRPVTAAEAAKAAEIIRRAATTGVFGPSGRKPRVHALEAARALEGVGGRAWEAAARG